MAATAIDPSRQGRYNLKIGDSLSTGSNGITSFSSVRYNHKSQHSPKSTRLRFDSEEPSLRIEDSDNASFDYKGAKISRSQGYALIFNGDDQSCTLERITEGFNFNLHSASDRHLPDQYPVLPIDEEEDDTVEGRNRSSTMAGDAEADETNPFDYRHFLVQNGQDPSPSPSPPPMSPRKTAVRDRQPEAKSTPVTNPLKKKTAPVAKKKSTTATTAANSKQTAAQDRRASTTRSTAKKPTLPKGKAKPAPKSAEFIDSSDSSPNALSDRESHKVHTRDDEDDDEDMEETAPLKVSSGGLEIDFGDEQPTKKKASSLLYANGSARGPISLRSAANSPNPMGTPHRDQKDDELEIDFGDSQPSHRHTYEQSDEEEEEDAEAGYQQDHDVAPRPFNTGFDMDGDSDDGEENVDVESIALGSPAHVQQPAAGAADGDDFEAQMMQALEAEGGDEEMHDGGDESEESEAD